MNDTVDASSKYQDSLPISSDAIMEQLDNWGIAFTRSDHVPLRTVEQSKKVQGQFLSSEQGGGHVKNLYLRDNKKRNVLLVAEQQSTELLVSRHCNEHLHDACKVKNRGSYFL